MTFRVMGRRFALVGLGIVAAATVACSGDPKPAVTTTPTPLASAPAVIATPSAPAAATSATPSATPSPAAAVRKVNANTATRADIQAALAAAGVPSPAQWAREVEEYRPYPADDPSWAKLRKELAKYNPAPGVVDQIIAVLTP